MTGHSIHWQELNERQVPLQDDPWLRQLVSEPPCEVMVYLAGNGHAVIRQRAGPGELDDARIYLHVQDLPRLMGALTVLERGRVG